MLQECNVIMNLRAVETVVQTVRLHARAILAVPLKKMGVKMIDV